MGLGVAVTDDVGFGSFAHSDHGKRHEILFRHLVDGSGLTSEMATRCEWDDELVSQSGIFVAEVPFLSVGGGIGSFATIDFLRISGVPASLLEVVGPFSNPYGMLKRLLDNSQIPSHERIRSGSSDRVDNIWGWPGYSLEEAYREKQLGPLWHSISEPILSEYHTPRASQVYNAVDREGERIGWASMYTPGRVPFIRKRKEGGYFVVIVPHDETYLHNMQIRKVQYIHLSVGFSGIHRPPDSLKYETETLNNGIGHDVGMKRVVNVYEPHEHVYENLVRNSGSVLLRGSASSAMQVIQRLAQEHRQSESKFELFHLIRDHSNHNPQPLLWRIPRKNNYSYQAFTFAKGSFGGQIQQKYRKIGDDKLRAELLSSVASTAIPHRRLWEQQIAQGKRDGWYHPIFGDGEGFEVSDNGKVMSTICNAGGDSRVVETDFLIDATGVEANLNEHEILSDLVNCTGAKINPLGQLAVKENFEVEGTASPTLARSNFNGKVYATGIATLGNTHTIAMYSFWGLQYSAWKLAQDLAESGFCHKMTSFRSTIGWLRRIGNREP